MHELQRFQNLRKKIVECMNGLLTTQLAPTNQMVRNLIRIQDSYINTYHPDFMGGANSIVNVFDINNYHKEQLNAMKLAQRDRADSYDQLDKEEGSDQPMGQAAHRAGKFGVDMIVQKSAGAGAASQDDIADNGRLKNFNEYEI